MRLKGVMIAAGLLAACNPQPAQNQPAAETAEPPAVNAPAPAPEPPAVSAPAPAPEANAALPDDRTPLVEPKGPIDPRSAEAAGQVVQHYGALIEGKRWLKAERLWGDIEAARAFATMLGAKFREVHVEIGKLGEMEGAAGSSYLTEPVVLYGKARTGKDLRVSADVILRRVNDVPGSTAAQRRWHIERIELKKPA